ncbi:TPA: hypothetical protein DIV45_02380 [Patescibacteria group bacterium]|nr:hypothetical protein [Patescibacteria group bacterium]
MDEEEVLQPEDEEEGQSEEGQPEETSDSGRRSSRKRRPQRKAQAENSGTSKTPPSQTGGAVKTPSPTPTPIKTSAPTSGFKEKAGEWGKEAASNAARGAAELGWGGIKEVFKRSGLVDDDTAQNLQQIEDNFRGGIEAINRAINAPLEIAQKIKKINDAVRLATELPQRLEQARQILQNAKTLSDVINAYNTLVGSGEVIGATGASGGTAGGVIGGTIAGTGVATGAAIGTGAVTAVELQAAGVTGEAVGAAVVGAAPVWLTILIIILIIVAIVVAVVFLLGKNNISSLAGGSFANKTNYSSMTDQALVEKLKTKMTGCDPQLVIYEQGKGDIDWQKDEKTNQYFHKLDIRLLKTIDYLTEKHRIKIGLLNTGAPTYTQNNLLVGLKQFNPNALDDGDLPENWLEMTAEEQRKYLDEALTPEERKASEEVNEQSAISALATGQAMAITEIDRSTIPELQNSGRDACNKPVAAPVAINWQKTQSERLIRPAWEELSWIAGQLDQLTPYFEALYSDQSGRVDTAATNYKLSLIGHYGFGAHAPIVGYINWWSHSPVKSLFMKIKRANELLQRINSWNYADLHPDTLSHAATALANITELNNNISISDPMSYDIVSAMSQAEMMNIIKSFGSPEMAAALRQSVFNIYKMTQVANMVGWDQGGLAYREAYESRNKIRQVAAELLQMPTRVSFTTESPWLDNPAYFESTMAVKQIITFSPEDDLDDGPVDLDVFPFGLDGVGVEGISMDNSGADGQTTAADQHFSHRPIDNGVFSKSTTNFIFDPRKNQINPEIINPFTTTWDKVVDADLWLMGGLVAGTFAPIAAESIETVSYQKFLYVAF